MVVEEEEKRSLCECQLDIWCIFAWFEPSSSSSYYVWMTMTYTQSDTYTTWFERRHGAFLVVVSFSVLLVAKKGCALCLLQLERYKQDGKRMRFLVFVVPVEIPFSMTRAESTISGGWRFLSPTYHHYVYRWKAKDTTNRNNSCRLLSINIYIYYFYIMIFNEQSVCVIIYASID